MQREKNENSINNDFLHFFNPNKAGLFEGSFFWAGGSQFDPPSHFKKNLSNINITLYNC